MIGCPPTRLPACARRFKRLARAFCICRPTRPTLNPIEQLFAKLKALLRKATARTRDALWDTIGALLDAFTSAECQNYIANSGYEFV